MYGFIITCETGNSSAKLIEQSNELKIVLSGNNLNVYNVSMLYKIVVLNYISFSFYTLPLAVCLE